MPLALSRNSRQEAIKTIAATQPVKSDVDHTTTSIYDRELPARHQY